VALESEGLDELFLLGDYSAEADDRLHAAARAAIDQRHLF